jgi:uncharacterized pyridoxamine 5'-phosphate oxidase family protein
MVHRKKALDFLKQHHLGTLSTIGEHGDPWGAAIYFVVDDDFRCYFFTRINTSKYRNLQKHPRAALTVADDDTQTTVQATGEVTTPDGMSQAYTDAYRLLVEIHPPHELAWKPPVSKTHDSKIVLLCFTPSSLVLTDFDSRGDTKGRAQRIV